MTKDRVEKGIGQGIGAEHIAELGSRIGLYGSLTQAGVVDPVYNIIVATSTVRGAKSH